MLSSRISTGFAHRRSMNAMVAVFFALIFMTAPLMCIRFCQLKHASWRAADAAAMAERHAHPNHEPAPHRHDAPPVDDAWQMLRSIVEMLPSTMTAALFILLHSSVQGSIESAPDRRVRPPQRPPKHA
jgi:ABC-type nickel/cobalt efflux system permease component RcnA